MFLWSPAKVYERELLTTTRENQCSSVSGERSLESLIKIKGQGVHMCTHAHTHTSEDTRCAKKKGELSLSMDFMRKKELKYHSCKSLELEKAPCKIWDLDLNLRDSVREPKIR